MARGAASPSTTTRNASMLGHSCAIGSTPLLGRPGTLLPVTVAECELLLATGSTGVLDVRDAVLATGVVPLTVTVSWRVAVAPTASAPTFHTPVPGVYVPWLAV